MTELDKAMDWYIDYFVLDEHRNFSILDFRRFEVNGKEYRMADGTFRNKILERKKAGRVVLDYKSGTPFYTLPGHKFGKQMTPNHTGDGPLSAAGRKTPIYKWIKNMPVEKQSLHNIRLTFEAKGIWTIFSRLQSSFVGYGNKDIKLLPTWKFLDDIDVTITIHHTDTVSIALACSYRPIAIDVNDIFKLFEILTRTEMRLTNLTDEYSKSSGCIVVPRYTTWIVKIWHFGVDSIDKYSGKEFHVTVEEGLSDLFRIYTKRMKDNKIRPRIEQQEYPNKPIVEAILDKLYPGVYLSS